MPDNTTTADADTYGQQGLKGCGIHKKPWSLPEVAVMVGGFIVFWPLGLAALAVKMFKGEMWRGSSEYPSPWKSKGAADMKDAARAWKADWQGKWNASPSGNQAFDDYKKATLERLEAERRKLEGEQRAFADYVAKLRRAKDQDEFDRFMAERAAKPASE